MRGKFEFPVNPEHHPQLEKILDENRALRRMSRIADAPLSAKVQTVPPTPENVAAYMAGLKRIQEAQANHTWEGRPDFPRTRSLRRTLQAQGRTWL